MVAMSKPSGMIIIEQVHSANRRPEDQQATLIGLGLGRIGKQANLEDTPAVRGMIRKVQHLVKVLSDA